MKKEQMYSAIGGDFEYLNSDCGYEQWSQYLIETLKSVSAGSVGVDIGCGNGYFTRALYKAGYKVTGMDISPEVLTRAVELARSEGVAAEFLYGDITKLKLNERADFVTAINDCINYVPQSSLLKAFKSVAANLKKGGAFIFDVSSENKLKNIIGNNLFVRDADYGTVIWYNSLKGDRVEMDITYFKADGHGKYERRDESQVQYVHTEEDVLKALTAAGFAARTEGHLGKEKTQRINFICTKL